MTAIWSSTENEIFDTEEITLQKLLQKEFATAPEAQVPVSPKAFIQTDRGLLQGNELLPTDPPPDQNRPTLYYPIGGGEISQWDPIFKSWTLRIGKDYFDPGNGHYYMWCPRLGQDGVSIVGSWEEVGLPIEDPDTHIFYAWSPTLSDNGVDIVGEWAAMPLFQQMDDGAFEAWVPVMGQDRKTINGRWFNVTLNTTLNRPIYDTSLNVKVRNPDNGLFYQWVPVPGHGNVLTGEWRLAS